jgi:hypothetical protein
MSSARRERVTPQNTSIGIVGVPAKHQNGYLPEYNSEALPLVLSYSVTLILNFWTRNSGGYCHWTSGEIAISTPFILIGLILKSGLDIVTEKKNTFHPSGIELRFTL